MQEHTDPTLPLVGGKAPARDRKSHIFQREVAEHYVDEQWNSDRLFQEEDFKGPILEPCCGWGRIARAARKFGYKVKASDIIDRRSSAPAGEQKNCAGVAFKQLDFLDLHDEAIYQWWIGNDIVGNPPFALIKEFYERAISLAQPGRKVAFLWPLRRIPAATWLAKTPLQTIWMLNPRPSMPTGEFIHAVNRGDVDSYGKQLKVGGGTVDMCWLVWCKGKPYRGRTRWLLRDG